MLRFRAPHATPLCCAFFLASACGSSDETPHNTTQTGGGGTAATGGASASGGSSAGGGGGGKPTLACPDVGLDPTAGAIYYVCDCGNDADTDCLAGNDSDTGRSPTAPFQTYEKARTQFSSLSAGDSVAFCQGGAFSIASGAATRWVNDQCQAAKPCVVRDYAAPWGSGDEARPILHVAGDTNAFSLEDGGDADHEEGITFLNLDLRGAGLGQGFFFYNDIDDVLMCNISIDGFRLGVHVAGSNKAAPGSDALNQRIVLRNSQVTNNSGQGWLGAGDDCGVEYSYFENNGFAQAVLNHNIYFSNPSHTLVKNVRAVGNELYRSAIVNGKCAGVSLVVHGRHDGLLIENNIVREDVDAAGGGCWGIAVDTGYDSAEEFRNVTIRGNTVINVGNMAIGTNACSNCLIENNVIIHEQAFGVTGISVPDRNRGSSDLAMTQVTIRNNSLYIGAASKGRALRFGGEGTGHKLLNNAIHYAGADSNWSCLEIDLAPAAYDVIDHNLCFFPNSSGGKWESATATLAAWQSATSFDGNSAVTDPAFSSPSRPNYNLSAASTSSPMVNAGHATESAPQDHDGLDRDSSPDIGAHEHR